MNIASPSSASMSPQRRRIPIKIVESMAGSSSKVPAKTKADSNLPKPPVSDQPTESDLMIPISSRSLTSTFSSCGTTKHSSDSAATTNDILSAISSTSMPKPSTFKDVKQVHESSKHSKAGGGIFRPSGDHPIIDKEENGIWQLGTSTSAKPSPTSPPPTAINNVGQKMPAFNGPSSPKPPMTLFNFTRSWESLDSAEQ